MIPIYESKLKIAKQALIDWSLTCTFHCYPKVFLYENKLVKCVWLVLFILLVGFTGYLLINILNDYFDYEVVSKIQVVNEVPTVFPAVTVCNTNPFTTKEAEHFLSDIWQGYSLRDPTYEEIQHLYNYALFEAASPLYNDSFRQSLGLSTNTVKVCQFNQLSCNLAQDMRSIYSYNFGNCLQFNFAGN